MEKGADRPGEMDSRGSITGGQEWLIERQPGIRSIRDIRNVRVRLEDGWGGGKNGGMIEEDGWTYDVCIRRTFYGRMRTKKHRTICAVFLILHRMQSFRQPYDGIHGRSS